MRSFTWMYLAMAALTAALVIAPRTSEAEVVPAARLAETSPSWGIPHGGEFWKPRSDAEAGIDIGAVIERVEHAFRAHDSRLEAKSAGYSAALTPDGATLAFGPAELRLATRAVRASDAVLARASTEPWLAVGNTAQRRLAGTRGIVEHLEARSDGVELSWILPSRPAREALIIDVALEGMEFDASDESGHRLVAEGARLRIGRALAVDSAGRRWTLESAVRAGTLQVRVPEKVLAEASYPLAIDPTFGPEFELDPTRATPHPAEQSRPAITAVGNAFYVAWYSKEADPTFYGARVADDGRILDPGGVVICVDCWEADVAFQGSDFFVVYTDSASKLRGQRISLATGATVGLPIALGPGVGYSSSPSIAAGHGHLAVAHSYRLVGGASVLRVELLTSMGVPVGSFTFSEGGWNYYDPDIAASNDGWSIAAASRTGSYSCVRYIETDPTLGSHSAYYAADWTMDELHLDPAVARSHSDKMIVWTAADPATYASKVRAVNDAGTWAAPPSYLIEADARGSADVVAVDGTFWVAWAKNGVATPVRVRPYSALGVPLMSARGVQSAEAGTTILAGEEPRLATNGSILLATWSDARPTRDVYAARLLDGDLLEKPNILVSGDAAAHRARQLSPAIASSEKHDYFLAVWSDSRHGDEDVIGAFVDRSGTILTPGGMNLSNSPGVRDLAPAIASNGDGFFVVWQAVGGGPAASRIVGSRVDKPGPVGVAFGTAPGVGFEVSDNVAGSNARGPAVAWNGQAFFVAWDDVAGTTNVFGRFVKPDWHTNWLGPVVDVSQDPAHQWEVALAAHGDHIVAVWTDWRPASMDDRNVFATSINPSGFVEVPNEVTKEIDLLHGPGEQSEPAIASNGSKLMVTFTHRVGGVLDVHGVMLDKHYAMNPLVVSNAPNRQERSAVASTAGDFLVAWEDRSEGHPMLRVRRFDGGGTPLGSEDPHPSKRGTAPALSGLDGQWMTVYESPVGGAPNVWGMSIYP